MTRQVVLDTETTGLNAKLGDRIIEIGCVEILSRNVGERHFHAYLNPERDVDLGATRVHGLTLDDLRQRPKFAEVAKAFLDFVTGAEVLIHNADFDVEFINHELRRIDGVPHQIRDCCAVLDTLALARRMHPGQRNSLDALAKRYNVDNSKRELHGALLDAQILTDIYLSMTGGQVSLSLDAREEIVELGRERGEARIDRSGLELPVVLPTADELAAHDALLAKIAKRSGRVLDWSVSAATGDLEPPASAAA